MKRKFYLALLATACMSGSAWAVQPPGLHLSPNDTLEMQGLSVIVEQNHFSPIFFVE